MHGKNTSRGTDLSRHKTIPGNQDICSTKTIAEQRLVNGTDYYQERARWKGLDGKTFVAQRLFPGKDSYLLKDYCSTRTISGQRLVQGKDFEKEHTNCFSYIEGEIRNLLRKCKERQITGRTDFW